MRGLLKLTLGMGVARGYPAGPGMFRQMLRVMAEVVRQQKRERILQADSIAIALDDKAPFRVVRFRCASIAGIDAHPLRVHEGVLTVLRHGGQSTAMSCEDLDQDYSLRVADSVQVAMERLATPLGGSEPDQAVLDKFRQCLRSYASDGGAPVRKCGQLLQERYPQLKLMIHDRAHVIRRAALPLTLEEKFHTFWHHVFDKRHAVVPDLQNSSEWLLRLELIQRELLQHSPMSGRLRQAIRTIGFAKQRFDSFASPQAKYVALLVPIAILLASTASDTRKDNKVRQRCLEGLRRMTAEHTLLAGLAADFSSEVLRFVRQHDVRDHDIATTLMQKSEFVERLRVLLLGCRLWLEFSSPLFLHFWLVGVVAFSPHFCWVVSLVAFSPRPGSGRAGYCVKWRARPPLQSSAPTHKWQSATQRREE